MRDVETCWKLGGYLLETWYQIKSLILKGLEACGDLLGSYDPIRTCAHAHGTVAVDVSLQVSISLQSQYVQWLGQFLSLQQVSSAWFQVSRGRTLPCPSGSFRQARHAGRRDCGISVSAENLNAKSVEGSMS